MSIVEKSIGELLVDNGQISAEELKLAERESKSTGEPLSVILSRLGLAYEHHFKNALELKYGVTYVCLSRTDVLPEVLRKTPEDKLREHMLVPVNEKGTKITVVMVNPEHQPGLDALKAFYPDKQFTPVVCTEDDFTLFMSNLYPDFISGKIGKSESGNGAAKETAVVAEKAEESAPAPSENGGQVAHSQPEKLDGAQTASLKLSSLLRAQKTQIESQSESETIGKSEPEQPQTNGETGKFDLMMLQKHIEDTQNKSGRKTEGNASDTNTSDLIEEAAKASEKSKSDEANEATGEYEVMSSATHSKAAAKTAEQNGAATEPEQEVAAAETANVSQESEQKTIAPVPTMSALASLLKATNEARAELPAEPEKEIEQPAVAEVAPEVGNASPAEAFDEPVVEPVVEPGAALVPEEIPEKIPGPVAAPVAGPVAASSLDAIAATPVEIATPVTNAAPDELPSIAANTAVEQVVAGAAAMGECEPVASEALARPPVEVLKINEGLEKEGDDAAVIMLCNQILANGIAKNASTIHIEAMDKQVLVHYRILGQLMIVRKLPKILMPALTSRFRKMARTDTQDRRLPQDGRVKVRMSGKDFNLRLTVVPHTAGGEHILVWIE
ncbi:MAG: Flp pilus assembly complex ATPase component TadA [Leptolyngbya sp.]|nr:Flp pilus assembly complex ATPase component TadA [Candidatus Melainabacteria bacterium]